MGGPSDNVITDEYRTVWRNPDPWRRFTGLEVGNVLGYYHPGAIETVVDRYEEADHVTNVDVLDYQPPAPLDYIVSVSTLEHVGWDGQEERDLRKAPLAVQHLTSHLAPGGRMLITIPLGAHPGLDVAVLDGGMGEQRGCTLVRDGIGWRQTEKPEWRPYGIETRWASAVWVGEYAA